MGGCDDDDGDTGDVGPVVDMVRRDWCAVCVVCVYGGCVCVCSMTTCYARAVDVCLFLGCRVYVVPESDEKAGKC